MCVCTFFPILSVGESFKSLAENNDKARGVGGFPGGSVVKNLPVNVGDAGLIPGSGRSPGVGNGNPFQYSCLGNPTQRGAWRATVHEVAKESDRIY